jgi:hypothetical protein
MLGRPLVMTHRVPDDWRRRSMRLMPPPIFQLSTRAGVHGE